MCTVTMPKNDKHTNERFLNDDIIHTFQKVINSSPIFKHGKSQANRYSIICTFISRIEKAVDYFNSHSHVPKSDEELLTFLVYSSILRDGLRKTFESAFHKNPPYETEKKFFSKAKHGNKSFFSSYNCPTDEAFFEYLRAMAFAHPFGVSGRENDRPFVNKGEIHYCPQLIITPNYSFDGFKDSVGFYAYSSIPDNDMRVITISFSSLKGYVESRYSSINTLTNFAKEEIANAESIWKHELINRNQSPTNILEEIIHALKKRFQSAYSIEEALIYLKCPLTIKENCDNVQMFRDAIIKSIPHICDCVDSFDYYGIEKALSVLNERPKHMHKMAHYQLEKIFGYLNERSKTIDPTSDEFWGLQQAYDFSKEFAQKWVTIDILQMPYNEIKLLVCTACYLESLEQKAQD